MYVLPAHQPVRTTGRSQIASCTHIGKSNSLNKLLALLAAALLVGACSNGSEPPSLQSLGLDVSAQIQAGNSFSLTVPMTAEMELTVGAAPSGVDATVERNLVTNDVTVHLAVAEDVPRGAYELPLTVVSQGDSYELNWPFSVVDPDSDS